MTSDVDAYIQNAPPAQQDMLRQLRELVRRAAPTAVERLSYGMPSYLCAGQRLLHFASATKHVAVYGLAHVDADVPEELRGYLDHRSTLRFRPERPLPAAAIEKAIRRTARELQAGS